MGCKGEKENWGEYFGSYCKGQWSDLSSGSGIGEGGRRKDLRYIWRWNWSDLPLNWIYEVKEDKDSSDLGLSHWVIEGNILMLWKTGGRTEWGPMGSGNQEMLIKHPLATIIYVSPELRPKALTRPWGVSGRDDQYRSAWALLEIYLSLGKRIYFRMGRVRSRFLILTVVFVLFFSWTVTISPHLWKLVFSPQRQRSC